MEEGRDLIAEYFRFNFVELDAFQISSGRCDKLFVEARSRSLRLCSFPMEGGRDKVAEHFRFTCVKLDSFP
jgi:hypothetical protein